jgi:hypothetical protein
VNGAWTGAFLTAFGAIVGGAIGAFVQYLVSRNQQKEQRRNAEIMRQNKLADELRERVLEVISPATWFYLAKWKGTQRDIEENAYTIKLTDSIARVRLMLDAKVDTHAELMKALESVRSAAFTSDTKEVAQFENAIDSVQKIASTVISQASTQTTLGAPF